MIHPNGRDSWTKGGAKQPAPWTINTKQWGIQPELRCNLQ